MGSTTECSDTSISGLAYQGPSNPALSFTTTCAALQGGGLPSPGVKITLNGALRFNALSHSSAGGGVMNGRWANPRISGLRITLNYSDGCVATIGGTGSTSGYYNAQLTPFRARRTPAAT